MLNPATHAVVRDGPVAWVCLRTELCAALDELEWSREASGNLRPPGPGAYRALCAAVAAVKGVKGTVRGVSCARPGDAPPSALNEWELQCLPALRRAAPDSDLWRLEPVREPVPGARTIGEACRELLFDAVRDGNWEAATRLNDVLRPPGRAQAVANDNRLAALEALEAEYAGNPHFDMLCALAMDGMDFDEALAHVL